MCMETDHLQVNFTTVKVRCQKQMQAGQKTMGDGMICVQQERLGTDVTNNTNNSESLRKGSETEKHVLINHHAFTNRRNTHHESLDKRTNEMTESTWGQQGVLTSTHSNLPTTPTTTLV